MATSDYFLKVDGINGGSTTEDHDREFIAAGYEFDLSSIMTAATGAGGGSGATKFSPLIVDLFSTAALADLLAARSWRMPLLRPRASARSCGAVQSDGQLADAIRTRGSWRSTCTYPWKMSQAIKASSRAYERAASSDPESAMGCPVARSMR